MKISEIIDEDQEITVNGNPVDAYEYGDDRIMLVDKDFGDDIYSEEFIPANPKITIVTVGHFTRTITQNGGKF